ncbi:hypothetical protein CsSME_00044886 [Camellia sinensis var. sinensis]
MLQGSRWWLETWFDEVYEWHCREFTLSRRVWLAIEGVSLNAWNSTTFTKIASNLGQVFAIDGKTTSRMELERRKLLVKTNFKNSINGFCKLKVGQFIYDIRVSELEFHKIYMLGSSYYPKAAVKVDEGIDESNSVEGFLSEQIGDVQGAKDDVDHINDGEDVSVRSGNVLQESLDDDVALLSQVEDSFNVTCSMNGAELHMLEVEKSLSPNHASSPNHLDPTQALIFPHKNSPIRIHKSTNRRKKLSLLELGLPYKLLNKGRHAKGSNKKSKDAKLVQSSQPSQSSISSSTIRLCNKHFLNKLVDSDEETEQQDEENEEEYRLLLDKAIETLQMDQKLQIDFGGGEYIFLNDFVELEKSNKAKIKKN